jgi:hypothetical protein
MPVEVVAIDANQLSRYERIPIRFRVASEFRVEALENGMGGLRLVEEMVDPPYIKDYDALLEGRESPSHWPSLFDLSHWGCFVASADGQDVGGAAVAMDTPGVHMLEARSDLAGSGISGFIPTHEDMGLADCSSGRQLTGHKPEDVTNSRWRRRTSMWGPAASTRGRAAGWGRFIGTPMQPTRRWHARPCCYGTSICDFGEQ